MSSRFAVLALVAACIASHALAQPPAKERGKPADKAFTAALRDMTNGMRANTPTGETDQDFVRMMVSYHKGAIAIAKTELRYGQDESLKALAREIVTMHEKEIALMKAWEDRKRGGH